jgi:zinc/manganese transport system substrate-binding protein
MFNNRNDSMNFKFSNDSLDNVSKYDLLLYMGTSAEPWINEFIDGLKKGKVGIVNLSRGTKTLNYTKMQNINGYDIKINPYYWLSPDEYKIFLYNLKSAIQDKDPKNREFYEENYKEVTDEFDKITNDLKDASSSLQDYRVYTTDDDLDYIIKYLGINATKLTDLSKIEEYEKDFTKDSNKNLILYSDVEKFRTFKSRFSGVKYSDMEIKIPDYSDNFKDFYYNIISKFKGLAEKS